MIQTLDETCRQHGVNTTLKIKWNDPVLSWGGMMGKTMTTSPWIVAPGSMSSTYSITVHSGGFVSGGIVSGGTFTTTLPHEPEKKVKKVKKTKKVKRKNAASMSRKEMPEAVAPTYPVDEVQTRKRAPKGRQQFRKKH